MTKLSLSSQACCWVKSSERQFQHGGCGNVSSAALFFLCLLFHFLVSFVIIIIGLQ